MDKLLQEGRDIKSLIESMSDEERRQALALLQGMLLGKELATQSKPA